MAYRELANAPHNSFSHYGSGSGTTGGTKSTVEYATFLAREAARHNAATATMSTFVPLTDLKYWSSVDDCSDQLHQLSKHLCTLHSTSPTLLFTLAELHLQLPKTILQQVWPWVLTAAEYNNTGTIDLLQTPLNTHAALLAFTQHIFSATSSLFCDFGHENMLAGLSLGTFFNLPALVEITLEHLFYIVDENNVCDILSDLTLAKSPLRAKCMNIYYLNSNLLELHASSGKLRPCLCMEIHALHKALSETTSKDWKFAKDSRPSSYDEMIAIMRSSVDDQEQILNENKARVQNKDFVDGSGKHIDWNSLQMKRTRELYEEQEIDILAKRVWIEGHNKLYHKIVHDSVDSDGFRSASSSAESTATTTSNLLRQISNEGRQILKAALDAKFNAKAELRIRRSVK